MLAIAIAIRYCLVVIISLIWSFSLQRKSCKNGHFSWNAWQAVFFTVCIRVFIGGYIGPSAFTAIPPYIFTLIDLIIWGIASNIIEHFALTTTIKQQSIRAMSQCFFTNRITFVLLSMSVFHIARIEQINSFDFRNQIAQKLWLYELSIPLDTYINNVVVAAYNQQYSVARMLELTVAHGLGCVGVYWVFENYYNMILKYRCFFLVLITGMIAAWDMLLYSKCSINAPLVITFTILFSMAIWWFFNGRQINPRLDRQN